MPQSMMPQDTLQCWCFGNARKTWSNIAFVGCHTNTKWISIAFMLAMENKLFTILIQWFDDIVITK